MAKNILVVLDMDTSDAKKAAEDLTQVVESLGDALEDQEESAEKFSDSVDDAAKHTSRFGDIAEESLETVKGAFGLALGGATAFFGFIGGAGVAAINKFIEADKKTSDAIDELTEGFDELLYTFGNAVVGGDNFATVIETVTGVLKDMTTGVNENRETVFSFSKDTVVGLTYVVEWVAKTGLGVYGFFQFIVDGIQELVRTGFEYIFKFYDGVFKILGLEMGDEWGALGVSIETDTSSFRETERLAELLDSVTKGAEKVRGFFGESGPLSQPVSSAKTRRRTGGSGSGGAKPGDEITFSDAESVATKFQLADEALLQFSTSAQVAGSSIQSAVGFTRELAQGQDTVKAATEGATAGTKEWEGAVSSVAQTWAGFAGGFLQSSLQIVTAMSGQGGAWKAWQSAGLQAIGSVANYYADLLFGIGAGNLFISPGLSAAAFAGGLILKGVAGAVAGAADRVGASGGGRATTAARAAAPVSSGRDQGGDTTIILEMDGNRLAHTVAPHLARAARNGILTLRQAT